MNIPKEFTLNINVNVTHKQDDATGDALHDLRERVDELLRGQKAMRKIMATTTERLLALRADITTLKGESAAAFQRLEDKIRNGEELTPEEEAEFDALERELEEMAATAAGIAVP